MIKFYEKLFVVTRSPEIHYYKECPELGFMCHYENNAAFEKRKGTMRHWATRSYGPDDNELEEKGLSRIVDNAPVDGFSIVGTVSRSTTDNKLIRIKDPRGFILEISLYNFYEILIKATMKNGVIEEPLVWGRNGSQNELVHVDHPDYVNRKNDFTPKVGDYFQKDRTHYRYLGKFYAHTIVKDRERGNVRYGSHWVPTYDYTYSHYDEGMDSKVFHLYEEFLEFRGKVELRARRSVMKDCQEPNSDVSWNPIDLDKWNEYRFDSLTASGWSRMAKFYPKKIKVDAVSEEEMREVLGDV